MKTIKYSELPKEIKLQDDVDTLLDVNEELRQRIDKAIEYIDTTEFSGNNVLYDGNIIYYNQDVLKCLLNILRGEEDESRI